MRKMKTNIEAAREMMKDVFSRIGGQHGYENVSADFVAFKQFKVQWQRSYNWIAFRISDYMMDAPENVMEGLAESIFEKIDGKKGLYPSDMCDWVLSDEFSIRKRPTFIKRGRYLSDGPVGKYKNLNDSIRRLVDEGLIPPDHNMMVIWNNDRRNDYASTYSVLMRTVMVSAALDDDEVDDTTLDYVVYHQYHQILEGTRTFGTDEDIQTSRPEKGYRWFMEAENQLNRLSLAL